MGSTFSNLESEATDQEKISLGMTVFCVLMLVCVIFVWLLTRHKSNTSMHYLNRSMGGMPYPSPYGPARFSASSPIMPY